MKILLLVLSLLNLPGLAHAQNNLSEILPR
ncbi:MAG: hypothetical protein RL563_2406, partial [Pseudomonadota bacterium]